MSAAGELTLSEAFPLFVIADLRRAPGFHCTLLGAVETFRLPPDGKRITLLSPL